MPNNTPFVSFKKGDYSALPTVTKQAGTIYLSTNINMLDDSDLFTSDADKEQAKYTFLSVDLDNSNRINLDAARAAYAHIAKTANTADALSCEQVGNETHPVYFNNSGVPVAISGLFYGSQHDSGVIDKTHLPKVENPNFLKFYDVNETKLLLSYDGLEERIVKLMLDTVTAKENLTLQLNFHNGQNNSSWDTVSSIIIPAATIARAGLITAQDQSFAGNKTFTDGVHSQLFCVENTSNQHKVQLVYNTNTESLDFNFV